MVWKQVDETSALWKPTETHSEAEKARIDASRQEPRRMLLFHIFAMLDINESQMEFFVNHPLCRDTYISMLHRAVIREEIELDPDLSGMEDDLTVLFSLFHRSMLAVLKKKRTKGTVRSTGVLEDAEF